MLDAAKAVRKHVAHKKISDLDDDRLLLGGVIRELLLIGEAANAVSPKTRANLSSLERNYRDEKSKLVSELEIILRNNSK